jgi:hypothetical protein
MMIILLIAFINMLHIVTVIIITTSEDTTYLSTLLLP